MLKKKSGMQKAVAAAAKAKKKIAASGAGRLAAAAKKKIGQNESVKKMAAAAKKTGIPMDSKALKAKMKEAANQAASKQIAKAAFQVRKAAMIANMKAKELKQQAKADLAAKKKEMMQNAGMLSLEDLDWVDDPLTASRFISKATRLLIEKKYKWSKKCVQAPARASPASLLRTSTVQVPCRAALHGASCLAAAATAAQDALAGCPQPHA